MVIGSCKLKMYLPNCFSLKDKRSVLKRTINRVGREFNVSIAEVDYQDVWQTALLGIVTVSNDAAHAHRQLTHVVGWIERNRPDVEILDIKMEMI